MSRLMADKMLQDFAYRLRTPSHGVYVFVREGLHPSAATELGHRDSTGIWGVGRSNIEVRRTTATS